MVHNSKIFISALHLENIAISTSICNLISLNINPNKMKLEVSDSSSSSVHSDSTDFFNSLLPSVPFGKTSGRHPVSAQS